MGTKKTDIEYPFEHALVINYPMDSVLHAPSHYKDTGALLNLVDGSEGHHSGISQ